MKKVSGIAQGYRLIFGYLGIFLIVSGAICLLPLFMLIPFQDEVIVAHNFYIPGLSSIAIGLLLFFLLLFKKERQQFGKHQDSILLVLIWVCAIIVGAVPFLCRNMSFTDAIFESTSGYSATGLTMFDFSPESPGFHVYTFYRSLLLFFGGIGLVLIVASAISDRYGLKLYTAEGHNDRLLPNLAKSARLIFGIYCGFIVVGIGAYMLAGMDWFDAINHSIAAVATGGFSPLKDNIAAFEGMSGANGLAIEIISCVLMVLGATNFVIHLLLIKGKVKKVIKDVEIRFFCLLCIIFVPLFIASVFLSGQSDFALAARYGTFMFISTISTTGFANVPNIVSLGTTTIFLSIVMMIVGGGLGSTGGAIKQYRFVVAFKSLYWSIRDRLAPKKMMLPHSVYRTGERRDINRADSFEAYGYIVLYLLVLMVGTLTIALISSGCGLKIGESSVSFGDAFFEFASALSGTGLSVGVTGLNPAINWVLIFGMFAGRLEIVAIYFAFFRVIRDILRKETV